MIERRGLGRRDNGVQKLFFFLTLVWSVWWRLWLRF